MKRPLTIAAFMLTNLVEACNASTFEGVIERIQVNPGTSPVRVSIFAAAHASPCTVQNWFSYENGDSGIGKVWTSAVLAAYAAGKTVVIVGAGTCDGYGVESVSHIELK
jgi:hypothetical protein